MTRIFHWFLVVLFITLFMTGNNNNGGDAIHIISGYLLTSFVLTRIIWALWVIKMPYGVITCIAQNQYSITYLNCLVQHQ